jgi:hypothetical protein
MDTIRKQFSLDWLVGDPEQSRSRGSSANRPEFDEALFFYGQPIFRSLSQAENQEMRLHDLARALKDHIDNFRFEQLWEVLRMLASRSVVEVSDTDDPAGNYKIRLLRRK